MKKHDNSMYDLKNSTNKLVSVLSFTLDVFLYAIWYPNFSTILAWIIATENVNYALIIPCIWVAINLESNCWWS